MLPESFTSLARRLGNAVTLLLPISPQPDKCTFNSMAINVLLTHVHVSLCGCVKPKGLKKISLSVQADSRGSGSVA